MYKPCPFGVGDMRVLGICGCGGHEGVGDLCAWGPVGPVCVGTCGCWGLVGVGDLWVWGTCVWQGQVGVGYKRMWGTFVCLGLVFWETCVPDSNDLILSL